jgi:hypothetical protein
VCIPVPPNPQPAEKAPAGSQSQTVARNSPTPKNKNNIWHAKQKNKTLFKNLLFFQPFVPIAHLNERRRMLYCSDDFTTWEGFRDEEFNRKNLRNRLIIGGLFYWQI